MIRRLLINTQNSNLKEYDTEDWGWLALWSPKTKPAIDKNETIKDDIDNVIRYGLAVEDSLISERNEAIVITDGPFDNEKGIINIQEVAIRLNNPFNIGETPYTLGYWYKRFNEFNGDNLVGLSRSFTYNNSEYHSYMSCISPGQHDSDTVNPYSIKNQIYTQVFPSESSISGYANYTKSDTFHVDYDNNWHFVAITVDGAVSKRYQIYHDDSVLCDNSINIDVDENYKQDELWLNSHYVYIGNLFLYKGLLWNKDTYKRPTRYFTKEDTFNIKLS